MQDIVPVGMGDIPQSVGIARQGQLRSLDLWNGTHVWIIKGHERRWNEYIAQTPTRLLRSCFWTMITWNGRRDSLESVHRRWKNFDGEGVRLRC